MIKSPLQVQNTSHRVSHTSFDNFTYAYRMTPSCKAEGKKNLDYASIDTSLCISVRMDEMSYPQEPRTLYILPSTIFRIYLDAHIRTIFCKLICIL